MSLAIPDARSNEQIESVRAIADLRVPMTPRESLRVESESEFAVGIESD